MNQSVTSLSAVTHIGRFVLLFHNVLSSEECDELVSNLELCRWQRHFYSRAEQQTNVSHDDDPEVSNLIPNSVATRLDEIDEIAFAEYCAHLRLDGFCVNRCSNARVNKYLVGTRMRKHCDHITTLFDPLHTYRGEKGVPVLSAVGSLNEEYEGGQFVMWDSEIIPIAKGSVLVFPSSFMFPHEVRMVTKGERLSWVSWAW